MRRFQSGCSRALLVALVAIGYGSVPPALDAAATRLPVARPAEVGVDGTHLDRIDGLVERALAKQQMPGCVVLIARQGHRVFLRAYGHRRISPSQEPMTTDTVFDLASLTKPIATATSIMLLVERGQVRLRDPAARYLPEFGQNDKEKITVQQLLTHCGGLIADNPLSDYENGPEEAWQKIWELSPKVEPGSKFVYSDVGFEVLGAIVERVSGQSVDAFARENVFVPLGMQETGFLPEEALRGRAATTEQREDRWMRGEVHDPRAYALGGVAGHAGLFSTAEDLAVYAQMLLGEGTYAGVRVLSPQTVARMTRGYDVPGGRQRGLGWDVLSGYSSNRGELMTDSAFGHGGFTGTGIWIDPELELTVIFLSNRVHPDGKGNVNRLIGRIGTIAAAAIRGASPAAPPGVSATSASATPAAVLTGIDVLTRERFARLAGQRVGLITNHTGRDRQGNRTIDLLHAAAGVDLVKLFSPEHGLAGRLDQGNIPDGRDPSTDLPIFSLYGDSRRPSPESLQDVDTLVFDIQDIGTRFYTYISTMGLAMRAAAEQQRRFVVLDRPNPINGVDVAGPVLDEGSESFVGFHTIPVRHGMTIGELAQMFRSEWDLDLDLQVVTVENWQRDDFWDATGLTWINPSPNMRSLTQALLYPGIGLLETTNLSVGRGTDTPFEWLGAPWIDGQDLAKALNSAGLAGVRFVPVRFTPTASKFQDEECGGVQLIITDRQSFQPVRSGLEVARQLRRLYPKDWDISRYPRLLNDQFTFQSIANGATVDDIEKGHAEELEAFLRRRAQFLLYQ